jgi:hypothetical protein
VLFGECVEKELHTRGVESRQHEPEDAPRSGMHSGIEPKPLIALINYGQRSLSNWCPDTPQNGLEAEARFVFTPDFDGVCRVCLLKGVCLKFYLFLNSACSSVDARRLLAGRGA